MLAFWVSDFDFLHLVDLYWCKLDSSMSMAPRNESI